MTASNIVDILLPVITFTVMLIMGTGSDIKGFAASRRKIKSVILCFAAQLILLPAIAALIGIGFKFSPLVVTGLVLLSIVPSGALSNYYSYLARNNVAFSVVLTAMGVVAYVLAFPVLASVVASISEHFSGSLNFPVKEMTIQVILFLAVPMAVGMWLKHEFPDGINQQSNRLDVLANFLVLLLVGLSTWVGWPVIMSSLSEIAVASIAFTTCALVAGAVISRAVDAADRTVVTIECAVRNVPIALLVMGNAYDDLAIVGFFVGYFLFHAPILVAFSLYCRRNA